jgi:GAF domain-containing protein
MRIRQGNDFIFLWAIERNGEPEDFSNAVNIRLHFKNYDCVGEVESFQIVDGNIVRVEVSPEWASRLGAYRLILSYEFEDQSYSDGDQKCVVDVLAFNIVPKTSEADDITEMAKTTDIMIGLKGDKGLSAYQVWLEQGNVGTEDDYFAYLRQPATDAAASLSELEQTVSGNEALRVTAEQGRSDAEDLRNQAEVAREEAEGIRDSNETDRINAEGIRDANETDRINAERDRADAEELREQAEIAREEAEGLRQTNTNTAIQNAVKATTAANTAAGLANNAATAANTAAGDANNAAETANTAAGLANNAATTANTAAQNADNARLAIQDDLALKANHGYESNPKTLKQVEDDTSVKMTNLIVNGGFESGVPSWYGVQPILSGEEKLSGDSSGYVASANVISYSTVDIPCDLNDKLYISISRRFKSIGVLGTNAIRVYDFGVIENREEIAPFYNGNLDVWETTTAIVDGRTNGIRFSAGFFSSATAQCFVDNMIAVNLTETFGKGNEPTKEEFELLLATLGIDYFEGEITIPAQKIMQWQLALIRRNKNAIIALGGTII